VSDAGRHVAAPNRARSVSHRKAAAVVSLALVLGGLLAACGDDGDGENDTGGTTSTVTASSTTTTEDPEAAERQAVIAAYLAAEDAAVSASAGPVPDPDNRALLETHTGLILERRRETIRGLRANGWAIRHPPGSRSRVDVDAVEFERDDVAILRCARSMMASALSSRPARSSLQGWPRFN
jgi:hypothetical protein